MGFQRRRGSEFWSLLSWKIRFVPVPETVTVFTVTKTLEEGTIKILNKWQQVADKLHEDLFIRVLMQVTNTAKKGDYK